MPSEIMRFGDVLIFTISKYIGAAKKVTCILIELIFIKFKTIDGNSEDY